MSKDAMILTDPTTGKKAELPVRRGTHGPHTVDVTRLYSDLGCFTFDPGFMATASCRSAITYIDGDQGVLLYRGYPIDQLAQHSTFLEVAYLLIHGELPNKEQLTGFENVIMHHTMMHESLKDFYRGFYHDAHPMAIMCGVVGSLSAFYHDSTDIQNPEHRLISAHRLIAKMPTIAAACYKHSLGQPFMYPRNGISYVANFLQMMYAVPCEEPVIDPVAERALDVLFILHADHEQNASTSTVRLAGSSGANPFACIAAGIASLWGPAHGGANEAVLNMLEEIGDASKVQEFMSGVKDKKQRLMGFGHRVYKNYDPRAKIIREQAHQVLSKLGNPNDPLLELAMRLEEIALKDSYFVERKLYPNVDFYTGIIYRALGIPTNMFTVMFAIARTAGWIAHWMEMIADPDHRIGRPRQLYQGATPRDYVAMNRR